MKCLFGSKYQYIKSLCILYIIISAALLLFGLIALQDTGKIVTQLGFGSIRLLIVGSSILLLLLSLLGFYIGYLISKSTYEAIYKASWLSIVLITINFLLAINICRAGVSLLRFIDSLVKEVRDNTFEVIDLKLLMFLMAVFEECCIPLEDTLPLCDDNVIIIPCITSLSEYEGFLSSVGDKTCRYFSEATSDTDPNSCGGQNIRGFLPEGSDILYTQMTLVGIVSIIFFLLLVILTCLFARATYTITTIVDIDIDNMDRLRIKNDLDIKTKELDRSNRVKDFTVANNKYDQLDKPKPKTGTGHYNTFAGSDIVADMDRRSEESF